MRTSTIYSLCDPETKEVRYIGKTVAPLRRRLSQHLLQASKGGYTHLYCWIRSLRQRPTIKEIEIVPCEQDSHSEIRAIREHRAMGCRLTNVTDGGDGGQPGRSLTVEHRAKISLAGMGHEVTNETRSRLRAAHIGRTCSPEEIERLTQMGFSRKGKPLSAEHRMKLSISGRGRAKSIETIEKIREATRGRKHSPAAIEKNRLAHCGRMHSPETREKMSLAQSLRWAAMREVI